MDKIEYSDVYKFIASIGLICLTMSILLPWFITRDDSILLLERKTLINLTETSQKIIKSHQEYSLLLHNLLPVISSFFVILGLALLTPALNFWNKRQKVADNIQDETLRGMLYSNMTDEEKRSQIEQNAQESNDGLDDIEMQPSSEDHSEVFTADQATNDIFYDPQHISLPVIKEDEIDFYIQTENKIFQKLSELQLEGYNALQNIKLMEDISIDILLRPNDRFKKEYMFDIFVSKHKISRSGIRMAAMRFSQARLIYSKTFNTMPLATMIIIHSGIDSEVRIKDLTADLINIFGKSKYRKFKFITFEEVDVLTYHDFLS